MLPESIPQYSVGSFFGFAAHAAMATLCLVIFALYRHYQPLRSLFFFYLLIALVFLGWVLSGLQRSPESILLWNRILYAALALLPAIWSPFYLSLLNEKPNKIIWIVAGTSFMLAALALLGGGPLLFGFPMEPDPIVTSILRPQSRLLRPLIQSFCLAACLFYLIMIVLRLRPREQRRVYLISVAIGLSFWFLGGLHDTLRANGVTILTKDRVLWFASFWLSIFLTIAVTLHFRSLEQAVREAKDVFERFVPPAYLRRIAAEGLGAIRLGEADQQWVTILCCDVRGFTALSERLNPSQLVAFINRFLERMTRIVDRWQGVIDKFLGDAVLCIFEGADSAERAVACGLNMLSALNSFNAEENRASNDLVQIGIGVHTGPVILGTIGSSERMDSTVLGLTVNLAKRLEEITKPLGVDLLISDQVVHQLPERHRHQFRKLGNVSIKGGSAPLGIIEVYDHNPPEIRNLKDRIGPIMAEGIELFESNRLNDALSKFQEAESIFPQDLPLHLLSASLGQALKQGRMVKEKALLDFR